MGQHAVGQRVKVAWLVAVIVFIPDVLWAAAWFVMDVLARAGVWPMAWDPIDIYAFIQTHPLWAESVFFAGVVVKVLALVQLIRKHMSAVPLVAVAFLLHFADWLLLSGNAYYSASVDGALQSIAELIVLACVLYMRSQGGLRGRMFSLG